MGSNLQTPIAEVIGERIQNAMNLAGLTVAQLNKATGWGEKTITQWLKGQAIPFSSDVIRLAAILHADPRWLMTGEPSDAAVEAQAQLRFAFESPTRIDIDDFDLLMSIMGMTIQPMGRSGTCRYCGVMHDDQDHSLWADPESSICYRCVKPKR